MLADGVNFLSPEVFKNVFQKYVHFMVFVIEKTELEYCSVFFFLDFNFFSVFLLSFLFFPPIHCYCEYVFSFFFQYQTKITFNT